MIYALTMNVAIDRYLDVSGLEVGQTNYYDNNQMIIGGKSINVCKLINEFSSDYLLISTCGLEYKEVVNNDLQNINKNIFDSDSTRVNIKLNNDNVITELNQNTKKLEDEVKQQIINSLREINEDDYLLIAGSFALEDKGFIIDLCKSVNTSKIVLDSSMFNIDDLKLIKPLMIKPNEEEIDKLFGTNVQADDYTNKLKELNAIGVKEVVLTLGGDGIIYSSDDVIYNIPSLKGNVVNTVGAGDSFVAGYLVAKNEGYDILDLLNFASACGSATAFSQDIATKDFILEMYDKAKLLIE